MTEPRFTGNARGKPDSTRKPSNPVNRIGNLIHRINVEGRKLDE